MARISYVEPAQAPPEVQEIYEKTLKGKPNSTQKVLAHRPELLKNFLAFYASVGRKLDSNSTVSRRLYELVYIRVSMINQCHYCMQHHLSSSQRAGLTPADWKALNNPAAASFTDKEKAALAFAEKLTRSPHDINDADIGTLKAHFSDPEIVDLDMLIGLANLTNRLTDPLGIDLEFPAIAVE
jgi:uncharacterized peroxidase-related enzyme